MAEKVKCLIIGSGPAGYTAGIYASRANLQPVLIEGLTPGGQLTITTEVENFPGYPNGKSGPEIMDDLRTQAQKMGTDIRTGMVTQVNFAQRPFLCIVDGEHEIVAETVIVATGATVRWLGIPSETAYRGFGVSACATCDGAFFRNKTVAVIGGGDTALEEASYLAQLCEKVILVHRRGEFRASKAMQQKIAAQENIDIQWHCTVNEILGEKVGFGKKVTAISLHNSLTNSDLQLAVDGVFIAIGHTPATALFADYLDLDDAGYIKTEPGSSRTNVPGVFAAGDVQDPHYRQAITAAASGCIAAIDAEKFLFRC